MKTTHKLTTLSAALLFCAFTTIARGAEKREIAVSVTVPDAAWKLRIDEVWQVKKELWVVATVSRDAGVIGAQVISTLKALVKVEAPDLPVKVFVVGKTWNWGNDEPHTFIKSRKEILKDLATGKMLYGKVKLERLQ